MLATLALAMVPRLAWSNGGPVAFTTGAAEGGVFPVEDGKVQLRSEHLRIVLDPDVVHYSVVARYVLANAGQPVQVTYGVPMFWDDVPADDDEARALDKEMQDLAAGQPSRVVAPRSVNARAKAAAAAVHIEVGRRTYDCSPVAWRSRGGPWPRPPIVLPKANPEEEIRVEGWCVARILIPAGDAVPLVLTYRSELRYQDDSSGGALTEFGPRTLYYPLFPAGYWQGTPDVTIELELGTLARYSTVSAPPGGQRVGSTHVWKISRADLRSLPSVVASVEARVAAARELATWNTQRRGRSVEVSPSASSELAAQGAARYDARLVADGDPATAWCEGAAGDGIGQWLELTFYRGIACTLVGYAVLPGYAKTPDTYRQNGRVSRLRIGPCKGTGAGIEHQVALADDPTLSAVLLPQDPSSNWVEGPACVRLTIVDAVPGTRYHDTCISEIAPVFACP